MIKYPLALVEESGKIIHISEVTHETKNKCICFECKEQLVAVNRPENKQVPHFRHKTSDCSANFETFIHWLAKEIIKDSDTFMLPAIHSDLLMHYDVDGGISRMEKLNKYFDHLDIPFEMRKSYREPAVLQEQQSIPINACAIEKTFHTALGDIRVDAVIEYRGSMLAVEPYFSNPISPEKKKKIEAADISLISIALDRFVTDLKYDFNYELLKVQFTNNVRIKAWEHLSQTKISNLEKHYFNLVKKRVEKDAKFIEKIRKRKIHIHALKDASSQLREKIGPIQQDLTNLDIEIEKEQDALWKSINAHIAKH